MSRGGGRVRHAAVVVAPLPEMAVGGCLAEQLGQQPDPALRCLGAVLLENLDRPRRREVAALAVLGAPAAAVRPADRGSAVPKDSPCASHQARNCAQARA